MAPLQLTTFNCNGIHSSVNDILDFVDGDNDSVIFLSEHWLQPHELFGVKSIFTEEGLWSCLKSSVSPEEELLGRPYGGVGFVCKRSSTCNFSFRPVNTDSDRIAVIQLVNKGQILLTIIGVYLPYFNNRPEQLALYSETLDILQTIIDNCDGTPFTIVGDMNASLPQTQNLTRYWYRSKPFNTNSMLLYDFMCSNDLCVANFAFEQPVNFTYMKGSHRTYIDHVIVPCHAMNRVVKCDIISHNDIIASDHLPVRLIYSLDSGASPNVNSSVTSRRFPRLHWDKQSVQDMYVELLSQALCGIQLDYDIPDSKTAKEMVDRYSEKLTSIIHEVCEKISKAQKPGGRKLPWWNAQCTIARDRMRFWRNIWKQSDMCRTSHAFSCYKHAKKIYRQIRRHSLVQFNANNSQALNHLFRYGNTKKFWNKIKVMRQGNNNNQNDIDILTLQNFFEKRFSEDRLLDNGPLYHAKCSTLNKFNAGITSPNNITVTQDSVTRCINKLKLGRSPGYDGIQPEHLKFGINAGVPRMLSFILTICGRYGILPDSFCTGLLVPIIKKPTMDPSIPKSYRPIIVSTMYSKVLEYFILESVTDYVPHDLQFGFVEGRNTNMAICVSRDVINYFNNRGSAVYSCTLDAEQAFDGIPHFVLLQKAIDIIPDPWWHVLYVWYENLVARVKWNGCMSEAFRIEKGTRQGGLTSPLLFNLFYYDLVNNLSDCNGLKIKNVSYNIFAYADDIMLLSSTSTGLQSLIDKASIYLNDHGLRFNAEKTKCCIFGKCFLETASWSLNGKLLECTDNFEYLGACMSNKSKYHVDKRMKSCRQSFFSLQSAMKKCNPYIISHLWKAAVQPTLLYANECVPLRKVDVNNMDKLQAKLLKCSLSLSKFSLSSPLLSALNVKYVTRVRDQNCIKLLRRIMYGTSRGRQFYFDLLAAGATDATLLARCNNGAVSLFSLLLDDKIHTNICNVSNDGLVDSIKQCFNYYNPRNRNLVKLLLSPQFRQATYI